MDRLRWIINGVLIIASSKLTENKQRVDTFLGDQSQFFIVILRYVLNQRENADCMKQVDCRVAQSYTPIDAGTR